MQEPTFHIHSEQFNLVQKNEYMLGASKVKYSDSELINFLKQDAFKLIQEYSNPPRRYIYSAYIIRNHTSKFQKGFLKWRGFMSETAAFRVDGDQLSPLEKYPGYDIFWQNFPPGDTTIVFYRLMDGHLSGVVGTTKLQDFRTVVSETESQANYMSGMIGIVAIMILYNLGMFLFFRKTYFLYYVLYCFLGILSFAHLVGPLTWSAWKISGLINMALIFLLLFCRGLLEIKASKDPWMTRAIQCAVILNILASFYSYQSNDMYGIFVAAPLTILVCLTASLLKALQGVRNAYFLSLGWSIFFASAILSILSPHIGLYATWASYSSLFGFALEIVFFSFALGDKVRQSERRVVKEKLHAFAQLSKVFYPHQIEQIRQGKSLEDTMPIGTADACVLCFDVIDSSNLTIAHKEQFLQESIKACTGILDDGYSYSKGTLIANAYRIKEMGDGFLCSVGFPFRALPNRSVAEQAIDLAERFIQIFEEFARCRGLSEDVFCSVSVVMDKIEGRFPITGVKEYDVYGRGVVTATRYEKIRKDILDYHPCHIISVQNKVYDQLSKECQMRFEEINLDSISYKIRGDVFARRVYIGKRYPKEISKSHVG